MRRRGGVRALRATVSAGLCGLAGCAFWDQPGAAAPAAPGVSSDHGTASSAEAAHHPDRRFLARYGGETFRVNVRYVPFLSESVIAVRRGPEDAAAWPTITLDGPAALPQEPFASPVWEGEAVAIAAQIEERGGICENGGDMALTMDGDGEPRTLFRGRRDAWVVFARCPEDAA